MRWVLMLLLLLPIGARSTVIYSETFSSYPVGAQPTNWIFFGQTEGPSVWTVQQNANWGGAKGLNETEDVWNASIYTGTSFDTSTYFDFSVRCDASSSRASIIWNLQGVTLDGATQVGCYVFQYESTGNCNLGMDWFGGIGYVVALGSAINLVANPLDFVLRVVHQGTSIKCYADGTEVISVTDPTYSSGYIGLQSLFPGASWGNISIDNGVVPPEPFKTIRVVPVNQVMVTGK